MLENLLALSIVIANSKYIVNSMECEHEIRAWMNNYTSLFYVDVITYSYPDPDDSSANLYW